MEELKKGMTSLKEARDTLKNTSEKDMWRIDLKAFENAYSLFLNERVDDTPVIEDKKKKEKK